MAHYFSDDELKDVHTVHVRSRGRAYELFSAAGMFSKEALDTGTAILLDSCHLPEEGTILDLGCGIGVVGLLVKTWLPSLAIVQSDVTDKALALTEMNAKRLKVQTRIVKSDVYESLADEQFNAILVNPPRAAGKAVIERMIAEAPHHLHSEGSLQLVALSNKGGASYERMMQEHFGNVQTIARQSGFKVYMSVKH